LNILNNILKSTADNLHNVSRHLKVNYILKSKLNRDKVERERSYQKLYKGSCTNRHQPTTTNIELLSVFSSAFEMNIIIYVLLAIWAVGITAAALWMLNLLWCLMSASHSEALIEADKIEANAEKSDKKETGNPAAIEPTDQASDREVEAMAYFFVCMSIVWWWTLVLSRELVTTIGEQDHQLAENELPSPSSSTISKQEILCPMHQSWLDGQHFPEESKPDVEITGKEPEKIQPPDPEVEPDKKPTPPPTNPHHEIPLDQFPKELKLAEFGKEEMEEKWKEDAIEKSEQDPDVKDEPEAIPIAKSSNQDNEDKNDGILYPCLKELIVAELGKQELDEARNNADPVIDDKKADVEKKVLKIEIDKKLFAESDENSPRLGKIPSKNLKLKKLILLKIFQPLPLPQKDWYIVVRAEIGGKTQKFKSKSNVDEWSTPPLYFDVDNPYDRFCISVAKKKKTTFGSNKVENITGSGWMLPSKLKQGTIEYINPNLTDFIPDVTFEIMTQDVRVSYDKEK
jgi:hypothetical protein